MEYTFINPKSFQTDNIREMENIFLRFVTDDETKKKIIGILEQGGYEDYSVNAFSELMNRWNSGIETRRRIGMAYLISQYPETFDFISKNEIGLFHGTSSLALPGILRGGLKSFGKLKNDGEAILSGEKWSMKYREVHKSTDFVSMSDDIETVLDYSIFSSKEADSKFGVIIGVNQEAVKSLKTCTIHSDLIEVRN